MLTRLNEEQQGILREWDRNVRRDGAQFARARAPRKPNIYEDGNDVPEYATSVPRQTVSSAMCSAVQTLERIPLHCEVPRAETC